MRNEVPYIESWFKNREENLRTITGKITLVGMSPTDREWFDENCPEWEQHLTEKNFEGKTRITEEIIWELRRDPKGLSNLLRALRSELAYHLSEEIINHIEPELEGFND